MMNGHQRESAAGSESAASDWSGLCRLGGIAAFILIAYALATIVQLS
jgi:hypothetical protein